MAATEIPPQPNGQSTEQGSHFDIATLTKVGAVAAALAYATGILTVNIYLHRFGITDFSFAKPKLVLTGILVLVTLSLLCAGPTYVALEMANPEQISQISAKLKKLPLSVKRVLLSVIPPLVLLRIADVVYFSEPPGLGQLLLWKYPGLWIPLVIYALVFLVSGSAYVSSQLLRKATGTQRSHVVEMAIYLLGAVVLPLVFVLFYIYIFALTLYPALPSAYGGGKPNFEMLVVAESGRCEMRQLGIPFDPMQPNVTVPLPVLHESESIIAAVLERPANERPPDGQLQANGKDASAASPRPECKTAASPTTPASGNDHDRWLACHAVVQIDKTLIHATRIDLDQDENQDNKPPQLVPTAPNECNKPSSVPVVQSSASGS